MKVHLGDEGEESKKNARGEGKEGVRGIEKRRGGKEKSV